MLPLSRHGTVEIVVGTLLLAVIGTVLSWFFWPLGLIVLPVFVWLIAFFRDPERVIPDIPHAMVSPADGTVSDVEELPGTEMMLEPCVRVGIFLSVFNVHINRAPCRAKVKATKYKTGKFINAMSHNQASEHNESNTLLFVDDVADQPIAVVKQIVGLIARRIICTVKIDEIVDRGQRIGLIKFGSRTELYIPLRLGPTVQVKIGQKLAGGRDVVATLAAADHATPMSGTILPSVEAAS